MYLSDQVLAITNSFFSKAQCMVQQAEAMLQYEREAHSSQQGVHDGSVSAFYFT